MGFFASMECDSIEDYSRGGVSSDFSDFSDFSVSSEERKTGGLHLLVPTTQATLGSPTSLLQVNSYDSRILDALPTEKRRR